MILCARCGCDGRQTGNDNIEHASISMNHCTQYISKFEFYFLGLPQPQKALESRQNPEKHESEKVRSPFLERLGLNFYNIPTHYKSGN